MLHDRVHGACADVVTDLQNKTLYHERDHNSRKRAKCRDDCRRINTANARQPQQFALHIRCEAQRRVSAARRLAQRATVVGKRVKSEFAMVLRSCCASAGAQFQAKGAGG